MCGLGFVGLLILLFYALLVSCLLVYVAYRLGMHLVVWLRARFHFSRSPRPDR